MSNGITEKLQEKYIPDTHQLYLEVFEAFCQINIWNTTPIYDYLTPSQIAQNWHNVLILVLSQKNKLQDFDLDFSFLLRELIRAASYKKNWNDPLEIINLLKNPPGRI